MILFHRRSQAIISLVASLSSELPHRPFPAFTAPAPTAGFAVSHGVRLRYLDWGGSGEAIVFVTGLGFTAEIFGDLAAKLTRKHRVIAVDRRGAGDSDRPATGYDLQTLTDDLAAVLDTLGLRTVILAGHAMGGREITELAMRDSD